MGSNTIVYGHRGIPALLPENTIESFAKAIALGADAIETDVRLTRDGHVVVFHDPTGERVAGEQARVREIDLSEIRRWDAGWGWEASDGSRPHAAKGYRVPTVEQLLVGVPGVLINIDAKSDEVVEPLVRLLKRLGAEHRVRITSFSSRCLWRARGCGWTGKMGMGQREVVRLLLYPLWLLGRQRVRALSTLPDAVQVPVRHGPIRFDVQSFLDKAHALGLRVDFWTVDSAEQARRLKQLGADGIVTNDVRVVVSALSS
jgi:glycerophosphoryl diester phosphodiesterase